ncbi:MAG: hypothetical protein FD174_672 [Geobacteraceae bacterium]|nr:MAG: hypothetical protein FD174_672 [Geobacteraceae bacterium]
MNMLPATNFKLFRFFLSRFTLGFIIILVLFSKSAFGLESSDAQIFIAGFNAYQKKDYQTVIEKMSLILQVHPDTPLRDMSLYYLARANFRVGNQENAAKYMLRLIKEYPGSNLKGTVEAELLDLVARYQKGEKLAGDSKPQKVFEKIPTKEPSVDQAFAEKERITAEKGEKDRIAFGKAAAEKPETERLTQQNAAVERAKLGQLADEKATREKAELERLTKEKAERERLAAEKAEKERLERIKAEEKRIAAERAAAEQAERERIAAEKAVQEKAELERIARKKADQERLAAEKAEKERLARLKAEEERIAAAEKAERERIAAEKTAQEKAELERIAREKAEQKRLAAEKAEKERLARIKAEEERIAAKKAAAEQAERERIAAEKAAQEKAELERIAREKAEQERRAAEQAEKERLARIKAEEERIVAELATAEKAERERIAAEKAAQEKAELERLAKEKAEQERLAAEKAEKERLARIKADEERIAVEKVATEKAKRERIAAEKTARENAERERLVAEKAEKERLVRLKAEEELIAAERAAAEKAEREQIAAEKAAQEKAELKRIAREKAELERLAAEQAEKERLARIKAEKERIAAEQAASAVVQKTAKVNTSTIASPSEIIAGAVARATIQGTGLLPQTPKPPIKEPDSGISSQQDAQEGKSDIHRYAKFDFSVLPIEQPHEVAKRISIPFEIINRGSNTDSFHLESGFPAEFNARFVLEATQDHAINKTPPIAPGGRFKGLLTVRLPTGSIDGQKYLYPLMVASHRARDVAQSKEVSLVASAPLLRAVVRGQKARVAPRDKIGFLITLLNVGTTAAQDITLRLSFPQQYEMVEVSDNGFRQETKGTLALNGIRIDSGEIKELSVTFRLKETAMSGEELRCRADIINNSLQTKDSFLSNAAFTKEP